MGGHVHSFGLPFVASEDLLLAAYTTPAAVSAETTVLRRSMPSEATAAAPAAHGAAARKAQAACKQAAAKAAGAHPVSRVSPRCLVN